MAIHVHMSNGMPVCEGWIEKFSVGRSLFSPRNWRRRYAIVTHEGIGYMHRAPVRPLRPSAAHCFVPFKLVRRKNSEVRMCPVYLLRNVTPLIHPEVSAKDQGTLSSMSASSGHTDEYHYFALSFEESKRRYFLLVRTPNTEDYIMWTSVLSIYVSAGSINTIVPVPHPLAARHYASSGIFQSQGKFSAKLGCGPAKTVEELYVRDPDPCSAAEIRRIKKRVQEWDEGEKGRWLAIFNKEGSISDGALLQERNEEEWITLRNSSVDMEKVCDDDTFDSSLFGEKSEGHGGNEAKHPV